MRNNKNDKINTPEHIAKKMAEYINKPGKVLDLCCGDGNLLIEVIHSLVDRFHLTYAEVIKNYIVGIDNDDRSINEARKRVMALAPELNNDDIIIYQKDALVFLEEQENKNRFDFIISNPPYIRIQDMSLAERSLIRTEDCLTDGNIDISLYFYIKSFELLKPDGKSIFIMPTAFIYNKSGKKIIKTINEKKYITHFIDFGVEKVFPGVGAYVGIFVSTKEKNDNMFYANDSISNIRKYSADANSNVFSNYTQSDGVRFGDICDIRIGIATLADSIFIIKDKSIGLEEEMLLPCFKNGIKYKIIYPYKEIDGKTIAMTEIEIKQYSLCYKYLFSKKQLLLARDKGKIDPGKWFLYGRTQGITSIFGKKIILPSIYQKGKEFLIKKPKTLFVGGYGLFPKNGIYMSSIVNIVKSDNFQEYLMSNSKKMPGGFIGINKETIKNYVCCDFLNIEDNLSLIEQ